MTKKKDLKWNFMKLNGVLNRAYKVSNHGDIVHAKTMLPLTQWNMSKKSKTNGTDYKAVRILGQKSLQRVHRIVCETFHGAPPAGRALVNHKDERKNHNVATNLQWVSPAQNVIKYYENNEYVRHSVATISKVKKLLNRGLTNDVVAQRTGMGDSNVSVIKLGYIHAAVKPYTADQIELGNI